MENKEIEISERRFKELIEATEKVGVELSEKQKKEMHERFFSKKKLKYTF